MVESMHPNTIKSTHEPSLVSALGLNCTYEESIQPNIGGHGVEGRTANDISADEHLSVLSLVSKYIDSAVSKTCNVGSNVNFDEFKELYFNAWKQGCKGITTFRADGKRYGILNEVKEEPQAEACFIDPSTGQKSCE
jgi:ribonucleoside-diphosphate reductase alpha chain